MSKQTWYKGYPPFTGWWCTKLGPVTNIWRWFDADKQAWSVAMHEAYSAEYVAPYAAIEAPTKPNLIEWTDYWPENARVPRVDPRES